MEPWCLNCGTWRCGTRWSSPNGAAGLALRVLDDRVRVLRGLPIRTDTEPDLDAALDIARVHSLSMYDAVYVELAQRREAPVATLDVRLSQAAVAEGLSLVE